MNWHYTVGDSNFVNRFQAVIESNKTNQPIHFHAPASYENFDFSIPISESLEELALDLALRLRQKYDRLIFWYSGGTDSDFMLNTFVKNKIKIDEIVCLKSGFKDADFEINNFALPKLEKIRKNLDGTKVTVNEPSIKDYIDYYKTLDEDKISKGCVNFGTFVRLLQQSFFLNHHENDKELIIIGREKPNIVKKNGNYYFYFLDVQIEPNQMIYNYFIDEPRINAKQSQLWLDKIKTGKHSTYPDDRVECLYGYRVDDYPDKLSYIGEKDVALDFKGRKIRYHNRKEMLAIKQCIRECPIVVESWLNFLDNVLDQTGSKWWNEGRPEMLPIGILSKFYCLDKKNTKTVDQLYPNGFYL
jgi:hypothetical protein